MYQSSSQSHKRRLHASSSMPLMYAPNDVEHGDLELEKVRKPRHHQGAFAPRQYTARDKPLSKSTRSHRKSALGRRRRGGGKDPCFPRNLKLRGTIFVTVFGFSLFWIVAINILIAPSLQEPSVEPLDFMFGHHDPTTLMDRKGDGRLRHLATLPLPQRPLTPHNIPIPVPSNKVSVVLINYSRPRMIQESSLMSTLLAHPNVDEILLLHANPKTAFVHPDPKVVNIDTTQHNDEMGLSLRFYFCQLAKNDWVLHVDDDMEFPASTLNELLIEYNRDTHRIVGRFGRNLHEGNSFLGYSSRDAHKSAEVVLTKFMVMERDMCEHFFDYADLVWSDVILKESEGPLWNGEDIFMSLVANHVYDEPTDGRKFNNYAMDWLDVSQAPDSLKDYDNGELDISGGMSGFRFWDWHWFQSILRRNRHYSYRGKLWHLAKERLMESPIKAARG